MSCWKQNTERDCSRGHVEKVRNHIPSSEHLCCSRTRKWCCRQEGKLRHRCIATNSWSLLWATGSCIAEFKRSHWPKEDPGHGAGSITKEQKGNFNVSKLVNLARVQRNGKREKARTMWILGRFLKARSELGHLTSFGSQREVSACDYFLALDPRPQLEYTHYSTQNK